MKIHKSFRKTNTREKCPNTEFFSGPYFPAAGLNTKRFSKCGKIRTRKNSVFVHFLRSVKIEIASIKNNI